VPLTRLDSTFSPQILSQVKCPKWDDAHHLQVVCALLYLDAAGLDPVNVKMGCGCKMKLAHIRSQRRGVADEHRRISPAKKPKAAKVQDRVEGMTATEKRRRVYEAQLQLWPTTRRSAVDPQADARAIHTKR